MLAGGTLAGKGKGRKGFLSLKPPAQGVILATTIIAFGSLILVHSCYSSSSKDTNSDGSYKDTNGNGNDYNVI